VKDFGGLLMAFFGSKEKISQTGTKWGKSTKNIYN